MKKILLPFIFLMFAAGSSMATKHIISQNSLIFNPSTLGVTVGDTIRWEWHDGIHTTTSKTIPAGAATWDSPLTATVTFFEYKVTVEGIYNYVCTPHETLGMVGTFTASPSGTGPEISMEPPKFSCITEGGAVVITAQCPSEMKCLCTIYDITGKCLLNGNVVFGAGYSRQYLTMIRPGKGVYFLQIITREGQKQTLKFTAG